MSQEGIAHHLEDQRSRDGLPGERLIPLLDTPSGGGPPPGSGPFLLFKCGTSEERLSVRGYLAGEKETSL